MFMIIMSTSCVATTGLEVRLATSRLATSCVTTTGLEVRIAASRLAIREMSRRLRRAVGETSHRSRSILQFYACGPQF